MSLVRSQCLIYSFYFFLESDCQFTLTEDSGKFQTPDFPKKYPNDIECIWNIQVQAGRFVLLSFGVFELESYNEQCIDLIEVKDGGRSTDELLGEFSIIYRNLYNAKKKTIKRANKNGKKKTQTKRKRKKNGERELN